MKKSIWIFALAVLLPSVVLGWLALRSAGEQQIVLERRTAELYQKETETMAANVRALIDEERRSFNDTVRRLLAGEKAQVVAGDFPTLLAKSWPRKSIGFAIGKSGQLVSPSPQRARGNPTWQNFLLGSGSFLAGTTPETVYWVSGDDLARPEQLRSKVDGTGNLVLNQFAMNKAVSKEAPGGAAPVVKSRSETAPQKAEKKSDKDTADQSAATTAAPPAPASAAAPAPSAPASARAEKALKPAAQAEAEDAKQKTVPPAEAEKAAAAGGWTQPRAEPAAPRQQIMRNVAPERLPPTANQPAFSQLNAATADFRELTQSSDEGVVTRFVQNQLEIIFWLRPAQAPDMVFGCLVEAGDLSDLWPSALPQNEAESRNYFSPSRGDSRDFILALLDDKAKPVATLPAKTPARDWKRPFVASEIGEALPHWEAALYLQRPEQLQESARALRQTLVFLIAAALGIIACGGWLVVADARRQLALAQQKTDFVSNVSHELKTPLTSIRMFAELMQNGRGENTAKYPQYLRIIMVEAERLTRLINNVLDFARLERKQKLFDKKPLDLHQVVARVWEGQELHLQESGFTTRWQAAAPPYDVVGDEDALAQILVNLLSNAEKYCGEHREVELHSYLDGGFACVSVLDRGLGVPPGDERKIFESFYRAHDSLSSGIQGSGLGLTLAQRLAKEHGGEILYQPRSGGGSNFTLRIPLTAKPAGKSLA